MSDSIFFVLLAFFFILFMLGNFRQRGAWPKIPRYMVLLSFAVTVPLTICLLLVIVFAPASLPAAILPAPIQAIPVDPLPPVLADPPLPPNAKGL